MDPEEHDEDALDHDENLARTPEETRRTDRAALAGLVTAGALLLLALLLIRLSCR
jgi:hypothetical protein